MEGKPRIPVNDMVKVALLAALTAVGAWIKVPLPFTQVPFTLQVFGVLLAGMVLGESLGALSMIAYILLGVVGVPVFAGGASGLGVLLGPTGGYLVSYPFVAFIVGLLAKPISAQNYLRYLTPVIGIAGVYVIGFFEVMLSQGLSPHATFSSLFSGHSTGVIVLIGIGIFYLACYPVLAYAVRLLSKPEVASRYLRYGASVVGLLLIYVFGASQLAIVQRISLGVAVAEGVVPFIALDFIKAIFASAVAYRINVARAVAQPVPGGSEG
ncbi:MAG: biotin transporter BioY [Chloroflexi bacterium]|nr:biotin transporter BioY [Chloroflexota bacterium]